MFSKLKNAGLIFLGGVIFVLYFIIGQKNRAIQKQTEYLIKRKKNEVKELAKKKNKLIDKVKNSQGNKDKIDKELKEIKEKANTIKEEAKSKPKEEKWDEVLDFIKSDF